MLQCFSFWFYIDGFMDGVRNESVKVVQQIDSEKYPDVRLWNWVSPTLEWTKVGQEVLHLLSRVPGPGGGEGSERGRGVPRMEGPPAGHQAWGHHRLPRC